MRVGVSDVQSRRRSLTGMPSSDELSGRKRASASVAASVATRESRASCSSPGRQQAPPLSTTLSAAAKEMSTVGVSATPVHALQVRGPEKLVSMPASRPARETMLVCAAGGGRRDVACRDALLQRWRRAGARQRRARRERAAHLSKRVFHPSRLSEGLRPIGACTQFIHDSTIHEKWRCGHRDEPHRILPGMRPVGWLRSARSGRCKQCM